MRLQIILSAAVTALIVQPAYAHVVFTDKTAEAGSYYTGALVISHGCDGAATTAVTVTIPDGIVMAKPQPKPGWTVDVTRAPLPAPVTTQGGKVITERTATITWRGRLADDAFDTFGVLMKLPAVEGLLYVPVAQTCESGELRWQDIPAEGQAWHDVPRPAPVLKLVAPGAEGHDHH